MNELTTFTPQFQLVVAEANQLGRSGLFQGVCRMLAVKKRRVFNPEDGGDDPYITATFVLLNGPTVDGRYVRRWHSTKRQYLRPIEADLVTSIINRCSDPSVKHHPKDLAICHAAGMVISYPKDRSDEATTFPHVTRGTRINYVSRQTADDPNKADLLKAREDFRIKHGDGAMVRLA